MLKEEAKERQRTAGGDRRSEKSVPANLPEAVKGEAREKAAQSVNVSPRSIASAAKVIAHGTQELQDAVRSGDVAVSAAAEVADEPEERQRELVAEGPKAIREAAKVKREGREEKAKPREDLAPVESFILRVRALSAGSTRTAEHLRAELRSALGALDSAQ
jgi:hypothetical protein